jgi:phage-related protein
LEITPKKVPASFYQTDSGTEPVRDWLKSLPIETRRKIGLDLKTVEYGWPIGMPLCRSLQNGLWEVRSTLKDGIARVIFFIHGGHLVLLNGFMKKSQKTPKAEIDLALKRKREVEKRDEQQQTHRIVAR